MRLYVHMNKVASTFQLPSTKVTKYKLCGTMSLITATPFITITLACLVPLFMITGDISQL